MSDGNDESLRQELKAANKQLAEWDKEQNQLHERNGDLGLEVQNLKEELATVTRSRDESKKSAPTVADFPEPAELLNQLKARRKKSRADLADMEAVLDVLAELGTWLSPICLQFASKQPVFVSKTPCATTEAKP